MLTAIVLVCSLAVTPELRDCTRENATAVLRVPEEFLMPSHCMARGQAFLAGTALGRELGERERVKVMCVRHDAIGRRTI